MIQTSVVVLIICASILVAEKMRPDRLFGMTADDMFELAMGGIKPDKVKYGRNLDKNYLQDTLEFFNKSLRYAKNTTASGRKSGQVTPIPKLKKSPVNLEEAKLKIHKMRIMKLLRDNNTLVPDFKNDGDDPCLLTRRFDAMLEKDTRRHEPFEKDVLRQIYIAGEDYLNIRRDKFRFIDLMRQFIYMIRYRLGLVTTMRKKYMNHVKYRIGYLFALLRLVRYQQKIIFATFKQWFTTWRNPSIQLMMYFKILKLHVDRKDLVRLMYLLEHDKKLFYDPAYYEDPQEIASFANLSVLGG